MDKRFRVPITKRRWKRESKYSSTGRVYFKKNVSASKQEANEMRKLLRDLRALLKKRLSKLLTDSPWTHGDTKS